MDKKKKKGRINILMTTSAPNSSGTHLGNYESVWATTGGKQLPMSVFRIFSQREKLWSPKRHSIQGEVPPTPNTVRQSPHLTYALAVLYLMHPKTHFSPLAVRARCWLVLSCCPQHTPAAELQEGIA